MNPTCRSGTGTVREDSRPQFEFKARGYTPLCAAEVVIKSV